MKEFIEKLIGRLEEISVSRDNDGVINGCNMGICEDDDCLKCLKKKVISIVNELAEEYKNGHFGCNSNGEHEKCRNCELDCKQRNQIWFGVKEEYINISTDTSTTNANRIRSMTDEELAEFISKYFSCEYECAVRDKCSSDWDCKRATIDWLQSEVEGVTENE